MHKQNERQKMTKLLAINIEGIFGRVVSFGQLLLDYGFTLFVFLTNVVQMN